MPFKFNNQKEGFPEATKGTPKNLQSIFYLQSKPMPNSKRKHTCTTSSFYVESGNKAIPELHKHFLGIKLNKMFLFDPGIAVGEKYITGLEKGARGFG